MTLSSREAGTTYLSGPMPPRPSGACPRSRRPTAPSAAEATLSPGGRDGDRLEDQARALLVLKCAREKMLPRPAEGRLAGCGPSEAQAQVPGREAPHVSPVCEESCGVRGGTPAPSIPPAPSPGLSTCPGLSLALGARHKLRPWEQRREEPSEPGAPERTWALPCPERNGLWASCHVLWSSAGLRSRASRGAKQRLRVGDRR